MINRGMTRECFSYDARSFFKVFSQGLFEAGRFKRRLINNRSSSSTRVFIGEFKGLSGVIEVQCKMDIMGVPIHRYGEIIYTFLCSYSFPLFVTYLIMVNQIRRIKKMIPEPYDLKQVMGVYNFVISLVNVYCFVGFLSCLLEASSLYEKTPNPKLTRIFYVYWITKVIELLDTVFMILRHKFKQVSLLHVYHHASMLLLSDLGYTRYAWAAFSMPLMLNALVHVFLYLYYGLTSLGMNPLWKRRLTELQIVQFVIDLVHAGIGVYLHNFCYWSLAYGLSMLYLFTSFYIGAYLRQPKKIE